MTYVVVELNDCSDPKVHGPFKTLKIAKQFEKKHLASFNDFDWRHESHLTICELKSPSLMRSNKFKGKKPNWII